MAAGLPLKGLPWQHRPGRSTRGDVRGDAEVLPETRYPKCGDVPVAYRVFGEGPVNPVYAPGFVSSVENDWDDPSTADWRLFRAAGRAA